MESTEMRSSKSGMKKTMSKILNFLCALVITFIAMLAIAAFFSADLHSKDMLGDYDSQIFSFTKTDANTAELIAFGEKFIIDFEKIYNAQRILNSLSQINREYTPTILTLSGDIAGGCISSVGESFEKIPEIIKYLYSRTDEE